MFKDTLHSLVCLDRIARRKHFEGTLKYAALAMGEPSK